MNHWMEAMNWCASAKEYKPWGGSAVMLFRPDVMRRKVKTENELVRRGYAMNALGDPDGPLEKGVEHWSHEKPQSVETEASTRRLVRIWSRFMYSKR